MDRSLGHYETKEKLNFKKLKFGEENALKPGYNNRLKCPLLKKAL